MSDAHRIAALTDHEAVAQGLPRWLEGWVIARCEGRIDSEQFRALLRVEPLRYAHPFVNVQRDGATLQIGEQQARLTPKQLAVMEAIESLQAAGLSVAARLAAWPRFAAALALPGGRARLEGILPRVMLQTHVAELSGLVRDGKQLRPARPDDAWAMRAGYRYFVRAAT